MAAKQPTAKRRKSAPSPGPTGVQLGENAARIKILQGAARLFARQGVRAGSVEDLLQESGVSRRTFYKVYTGKEDVALALYQLGTAGLVEACRQAMVEETDPLKQVERFIDNHLRNARGLSRLVYVLGGEAQRLESPLHGRRMEVHGSLVGLLQGSARHVDPMLLRALILAMEGVVRIMLEEGDQGRNVTDAQVERVRKVMMQLGAAALATLKV